MIRRVFSFFTLSFLAVSLSGQNPSKPADIEDAIRDRAILREQSLLMDYPARNIGPIEQGGRIVDIEVNPNDPTDFYVAYASGGIFHTQSNGQSWTPIFDGQGALGVGDFALAPSNPEVIWVGTGENNSSRSSYAGAGVYRSTNGGDSWLQCGLTGTQHIGRVIVHPENPDMAWVASIGALYTPNPDRGIYKTENGGQTWEKTLFINENTGIIDLVIDPSNPERLWASSWERSRKAYEFVEGGPGSAIYLSEDGGTTWEKSVKGFPQGDNVGRIGLAVSPQNPDIVYAILDNQEVDESLIKEDVHAGLKLTDFLSMRKDDFLEMEDSKLDSFFRGAGFPDKIKAEIAKKGIRDGDFLVSDIGKYFGDANDALFRTGVKGAEVYRSEDGGKNWERSHEEVLTGVSYTYGYYFGQIRVSPANSDEIYIFGVPLLRSRDGGANWSRLDTFRVHVDHHELWIDPANPNHILLGNDGGLYMSYDRGGNWTHLNNLPVGQFYTLNADMQTPYNVYGGLQDNGVWVGSSKTVPNRSRNWDRVFGGDGMFVALDSKDPDLVYTGFQFGHYFRINRKTRKNEYLTPKHDLGKDSYRWNWRTPFVASPHNHEIFYMGAQYLFRSMDMGENWERISDDLTTNRQPQGNVPFSTITSIEESPQKFGMIWVGTDDGNIQLTNDGGNSWQAVSNGLPGGLWVGNIHASRHDISTAFVSMTGYRSDDFHAYVYKTTDKGETWQSIKGNLPDEAVNVIIQDPVNPQLLYVGTDHGTYLSLDEGSTWHLLGQIPNVASYDMLVHPRENELVVATHGRSVYILDVKPLQNLKVDEMLAAYVPAKVRWSDAWGEVDHPWMDVKEPAMKLSYFLREPLTEALEIRVLNEEGKVLREMEGKSEAGYHEMSWFLMVGKGKKIDYIDKGKYQLEFVSGDLRVVKDFEVSEED